MNVVSEGDWYQIRFYAKGRNHQMLLKLQSVHHQIIADRISREFGYDDVRIISITGSHD